MPILIPVLAAVASFFGGAYVGTVVENATESPVVAIQSATVTEKNKSLSTKNIAIAGGLGLLAWLVYKKLWRR